jgi:DNA-binding LacI/PurR family transcriptional regulator
MSQRHPYYWVTSEHPGSEGWGGVTAACFEAIERGRGVASRIVALTGVDGRAENSAYQRLVQVVERRALKGLFLMSSATMHLLPVLQGSRVPRVTIDERLLKLDHEAWLERACTRLVERGRRIALVSPAPGALSAAERRLESLHADRLWPLLVGRDGTEHVSELLFLRADRPDAVLITDESLVDPVVAGMKRAKVRPGYDVFVLAHCNWPRPQGPRTGVERIGFDAREVLGLAKQIVDEQSAGGPALARSVPPRFAHELVQRQRSSQSA